MPQNCEINRSLVLRKCTEGSCGERREPSVKDPRGGVDLLGHRAARRQWGRSGEPPPPAYQHLPPLQPSCTTVPSPALRVPSSIISSNRLLAPMFPFHRLGNWSPENDEPRGPQLCWESWVRGHSLTAGFSNHLSSPLLPEHSPSWCCPNSNILLWELPCLWLLSLPKALPAEELSQTTLQGGFPRSNLSVLPHPPSPCSCAEISRPSDPLKRSRMGSWL